MSTCRKSHARIPDAWEARNCRQVGDARRGAGVSPVAARIPADRSRADAIAEAEEFALRLRRCPHRGFCLAEPAEQPDHEQIGEAEEHEDRGSKPRSDALHEFWRAKGECVFREGTRPQVSALVGFIGSHKGRFGVEPVCAVLEFPASTYYAAKKREQQPSRRTLRDEWLKKQIMRVWNDRRKGRRLYGARKVWLQLRREGIRRPGAPWSG